MKVLIDKNRSGPENMAVDVALTRYPEERYGNIIMRLYGWEEPCLSLGRFQSSDIIDHKYLSARGYGFVRRPTGGGAVLHLSEVTYSVVLRNISRRMSVAGAELYWKVGKAIQEAVIAIGVPAQMSRNRSSREEVCFGSASIGEIKVMNRKIAGNAQLRSEESILQHGSILIKSVPAEYARCFAVADSEKFERLISARMCGLSDYLGDAIDTTVFRDHFVRSVAKAFAQEAMFCSIDDMRDVFWNEVNDLRRLYSSHEWNFGRLPLDSGNSHR